MAIKDDDNIDTTTEDKTEENTPEGDTAPEVDYEKEYGCTEQEYLDAVDQGWNPEFDGPNKRSAKEFLDRSSFFNKIETQNKSIKRLEEQNKFLLQRAAEADKQAKTTLVAELKAARKQAIAEEDHDALSDIDEQLLDMKVEEKVGKQTTSTDIEATEPPDEYVEWLDNNQWYDQSSPSYNKKLHRLADVIAQDYIDEHGAPKTTKELKRAMDHVTKQLKTEHKELFVNPNKSKASPVEGAGNGRKGNVSSHNINDLSPSEQTIMRNMVAKGAVKDEATYIKHLEQSGFFKNR